MEKKLNPVCNWEWWGWDERCFISSPNGDLLGLYLEIQDVARLVYDYRDFLRPVKSRYVSKYSQVSLQTHSSISELCHL